MKTYGRLEFRKGSFVLAETPSYVRVLVKRVFSSVAKESKGDIVISATQTHARDLEWVLLRYPMEVSSRVQLLLSDLADEHKRREQSIAKLLVNGVSRPVPLAVPLRHYQEQGAEIAFEGKNLLLADGVGLGKTATSIGLFYRAECRPALVVTLTHLPLQWEAEIKRFAPKLRTWRVPLGEPKPFTSLGVSPDVVICPYSRLAKWETLLAGSFKTVVFDEVQELRRCESQRYRAATTVANTSVWRLGLSATPVYNYGGEMYWVMNALAPGLLGSHDEFSREWCEQWAMGSKTLVKDPEALGSYLRDQGVFLRRTAIEVGRELPKRNVIPWTVETDDEIIESEALELEKLATKIIERSGETHLERMQDAGEFDMRMRRATGIAKAPYVAGLVKMLVENGESVVLYGWHHAVYTKWAELLAEFQPLFFTGREDVRQKEYAKQQFVSGKSKVLILSLRAGAGLDGLQYACKTVVFGELDWSPGIHVQCEGRVLRDGQESPVNVYYAIAESGSDPVVVDVLGVKKKQAEALVESNDPKEEKREVDPNHVRKLAEAWLKRRKSA